VQFRDDIYKRDGIGSVAAAAVVPPPSTQPVSLNDEQ
jgi:hypothetical protein